MKQIDLMRKFEKALPAQAHKFDKRKIARGVWQYTDLEIIRLFNIFKTGFDAGLKAGKREASKLIDEAEDNELLEAAKQRESSPKVEVSLGELSKRASAKA